MSMALSLLLPSAGCLVVGEGTPSLIELRAAPPAKHRGWAGVTAQGPVYRTGDPMPFVSAEVRFRWLPMESSDGPISGYNVYRANFPKGQDWSAPTASGIGTTDPLFVDSAVTPGMTYYYVVRPLVNGIAVDTPQPFSELAVTVPPSNMVLVHRWMANLEVCNQMGRFSDPMMNYRCPYRGIGNVDGYFDIGYSFVVDRFERGCGYSASDCGGAGCFSSTFPAAGSGVLGEVHYSTTDGKCRLKDTMATWAEASSVSASGQLVTMNSNVAGLPPLVHVDQAKAWSMCQSQFTSFGPLRLPTRQEQVIASAWRPDMTPASISLYESGAALHTNGGCNTSSANGVPNGSLDLAGEGASGIYSLVSGSLYTQNCRSRYLVSNLVGNVWEWASDRLDCPASLYQCTVGYNVGGARPSWYGFSFDGVTGPGGSALSTLQFSVQPGILIPFGVPVVGADVSTVHDALPVGVEAGWFDPARFHSDELRMSLSNGAASTRGVLSGGSWQDGIAAGRFSMSIEYSSGGSALLAGFRCVVEVP